MTYKQTIKPNLDPVVIEDGKPLLDWYGWCLATVESAYNTARTGKTAWDEWTNYIQKKHEDRNWPRDVYFPIWFSGYGGDGHVAIALVNSAGAMRIWTSPWKHIPYFMNYSDVDTLARGYGVTYVGWSEDIGGKDVIEPVAGVPAAPVTPQSTHAYTIEAITPKQVKLNKRPTTEWNLSDTSWAQFSTNPVSTHPAGTIVKVVAVAHHKLGGSYYMPDSGQPAGYNVVDCDDYTPPPAPPKPAAAPEPQKPANTVYTKLEKPLTLVTNKQPTHVWDLGFADDAHATSVKQLDKGAQVEVYGRAQRTDHDRPAYFMSQEDFGDADKSGIPAHNWGINTVDLSAEPAASPEAPAPPPAAPPTQSETITVTVKPPSWQASYQALPAPLAYVAKQDTEVEDLTGKQPPQQLKKGVIVPVAGSFTKDGQTYFRTPNSVKSDSWYGVPESAITRQHERLLALLAEAFGTFERVLHIKK